MAAVDVRHRRNGKSIKCNASSSIAAIGIDLGKRFLPGHWVDEAGSTVIDLKLTRAHAEGFVAALPPTLIELEACASTHHWGRLLIGPDGLEPYTSSSG